MLYHSIYGRCVKIADYGLFQLVRFVTDAGLPRTVSVGGQDVPTLVVGKRACRRVGR